MCILVSSKVEDKLLELKAKVDSLDSLQGNLTKLKAEHVGTFHQTDVYFDVPKGRLKLRKREGDGKVELVYYERENIADIKESNVFILRIRNSTWLENLLEKALKTKVIVKKVREIYRYQGTKVESKCRHIQIHLDDVEKLGTFVEFEMKRSDHTKKRDKQILENLMKRLGIRANQLEKYSYSDLLPVHRK